RKLIENRARPAIAVETLIPPTAVSTTSLDVPDGEAVSRDGVALRHDVHILATGLAFRERAASARHFAKHALERYAHVLDLVEVVAEHLYADRRADARRQHVYASSNRRRDRHLIAGHAKRRIEVPR